MATNRKFSANSPLSVAVGTATVSGDPVVLGTMGGGVAITDYRASDGQATVDFEGVYLLSVKGINQSGNSAVVAGDALYYVAADTPKVSKKNTGVFFGWALDPVDSAATATIRVRLGQSI